MPRTKRQIAREVDHIVARAAAPQYHDNHLCAACGEKFANHARWGNPHAVEGACPSGPFPKWPATIKDEHKAGILFDKRVAQFWRASPSTFQPRR